MYDDKPRDCITSLALKLDEIIISKVGFREGLKEAARIAKENGFSITTTNDEEGSGLIFEKNSCKVSVFQPYPDIDRIYYEY